MTIPRSQWRARPPTNALDQVDDPVNQVFIHTTVTAQLPRFATRRNEEEAVRDVQAIAFSRGFYDISYSFLIPPSGRIYEGRGWGKAQAATEGFNSSSYSFATLGNTDVYRPTLNQMRALRRIINLGQDHGRIRKDVNVRGHREVAPKSCPGKKFTDAMLARLQIRVNS